MPVKYERWLSPAVFVVALLGYAFMARNILFAPSIAPYFVRLAQAFLEGKTALDMTNLSAFDLLFFNNQWYVAQPPLPAMWLAPFVALFGNPSDVLFGVVVGALSAMLCERVLRVGVPSLHLWHRLALTTFFAFGTAHLYLSVLGTVWFLGQICAVLAVWLFIAFALGKRPLLAGMALGMVLLARPSIAPGALLFAGVLWWGDAPLRLRRAVLLALPMAVAVLFLGVYNELRFDSPFNFGYGYINDSANIRERRLTHGSFSPVFLPENVYVATVMPPTIRPECLFAPDCPAVTPDLWGMGFLWTNPLFLAGVWALRGRLFTAVALATGLVLLPSLLYHNTGSAQFGYRFFLDALPFWMLALASAVAGWRLPVLSAGVGYSLLVTVLGTRWYMRQILPL